MSLGSLNFDICVIGGGINGTAIARDAAGRGIRTVLFERGDLAQETSSSSTKLIHGGLRYLEYYEFKLVRSALQERNIMLRTAPHIIWPLNFILPHEKHLRPKFLIRLGLYLYDYLAKRDRLLVSSKSVSLKKGEYGTPLINDKYKAGFKYSDCWVDDSRLVTLNAVDAADKGADIRTYTSVEKVERKGGRWLVTVKDAQTNQEYCITAKSIVNAAGPWVRDLLDKYKLVKGNTPEARLVKGSHIIVPRLYEGKHAYILQQKDKRIVFAIPYENEFTLIGTTEEGIDTPQSNIRISSSEIDYLCAAVNRAFISKISPEDILWAYSGIRPLIEEDGKSDKAVTRDYKLILDNDGAPILSVFGGKITTGRTLAEKAIDILGEVIRSKNKNSWTARRRLPGGDFDYQNRDGFISKQAQKYPWLPIDILERYVRSYGTRMDTFLNGANSLEDMGKYYGAGMYESEIGYLIGFEFAKTAEDISFRRSKLGLFLNENEYAELANDLPALRTHYTHHYEGM
ncbi:MAG: glycerol-3-phosphate dehydrogenase [Alphaproteobacteria bacterium]|nr:glycerol-3-phosphate dehydrogenase [Alphaproteobacteria bacterium]|tara:strand:- start:2261 stop:3802 length:1542 start_codon:yes stop_codon:yes gene_type:complete